MARYIDADALCAEIDEYVYPITTNNLMGAADAYFRIKHLIEQAPSIEARPVVRGEWLPIMFYTAVVGVKCSECNTTRGAKSNFCPSCGADMRGTEDDARSESR